LRNKVEASLTWKRSDEIRTAETSRARVGFNHAQGGRVVLGSDQAEPTEAQLSGVFHQKEHLQRSMREDDSSVAEGQILIMVWGDGGAVKVEAAVSKEHNRTAVQHTYRYIYTAIKPPLPLSHTFLGRGLQSQSSSSFPPPLAPAPRPHGASATCSPPLRRLVRSLKSSWKKLISRCETHRHSHSQQNEKERKLII
jgi:hypothetical protein